MDPTFLLTSTSPKYFGSLVLGRCMFPILPLQDQVRMAERSKALRSGRSPLLWAWVRIPLLTKSFWFALGLLHPKREQN